VVIDVDGDVVVDKVVVVVTVVAVPVATLQHSVPR